MIELRFLYSAPPLMAIYQCIKFHLIPFYTLRDMFQTSFFFIAKIKKGSNSINTGNRVMVLAFCNSLHSPLSLYQVSFICHQYFQRYALDKLTVAKIRKENNYIITCDRVTVLVLCTSSDGHLSMYQVSFPFYTFRDMLQTTFFNAGK